MRNKNSIERLNKRNSEINKNRSRRGEPIPKASEFEVGKLAKGRDEKLWIVKLENNEKLKQVKKWMRF